LSSIFINNVQTLGAGEGTSPIGSEAEVETINEEEADIDDISEQTTQSGRKVKIPKRLTKEMNAAANDYCWQYVPYD
jgi:hypothetical protein